MLTMVESRFLDFLKLPISLTKSRFPSLSPFHTDYFCRALSCNFKIARVNHLRFSRRDIGGVSNMFEVDATQSATKIACVNGALTVDFSNCPISRTSCFFSWRFERLLPSKSLG